MDFMGWFVVPAEESEMNNLPEQQELEGQELEGQVVVNKDEDIHKMDPPEKRFSIRLERANSEQKVGLAILNKGKRCKVYGVKPGGLWMIGIKKIPHSRSLLGIISEMLMASLTTRI